ncbi:helix-turn-helix domain-containing protein [Sphingosinicella sp. YJ22]|uniref:helix-turn-helix domain-containing protein n=1 Tax=Sphingosinicella sp. YJ22 TaxID=1104780 RepID=UPI0014079EAA|nr:helix-turn-helix domain-containing protein [Sphingosinicella sp. YJ22]
MDLSSNRKFVLLALADKINGKNPERGCWPSVASLVSMTGLSDRTVQKALNELEEAGHLTRKKRSGSSSIYHLQLLDPRSSFGGEARPQKGRGSPSSPEAASPHPRSAFGGASEAPSPKPEKTRKETTNAPSTQHGSARSIGEQLKLSPISIVRDALRRS